jgi:hypothetical protein
MNVKEDKKVSKTVSVQIKQGIVEKHEWGVKTSALAVNVSCPGPPFPR